MSIASLAPKQLAAALLLGTALSLPLAAAAVSARAGQEAGHEVGVLTCKTVPDSRLNLVVHSRADIECEFKESDGTVEHYTGETGIGFGVDLHVAHEETVIFTVIAKHLEPGTHQLAGSYGGPKAGVTTGVGGGAAVLIGGHDDSIGLKPAVSHSKGFGLAAGVGYLVLKAKEAGEAEQAVQ